MTNTTSMMRTETVKMILGGFVVIALGIGTATAAIAIGPEQGNLPAARSLNATPGISVRPAYGSDDEDCAIVARRTVDPRGRITVVRQMECVE